MSNISSPKSPGLPEILVERFLEEAGNTGIVEPLFLENQGI